MKKFVFTSLLAFGCLFGLTAGNVPVEESPRPNYPPLGSVVPTSPDIYIDYWGGVVNVTFERPAGMVQIIIENERHIVVFDVTDSDRYVNWVISTQNMSTGVHTIIIETNTQTLTGEFVVE